MPLVAIKTKGQVTLPAALCAQAGLSVGDLLEAKLERGKITLTPKSVVDRAIAEGLEDLRKGRVFGPFSSAKDMIEDLHRRTKKRKRAPVQPGR